MVKHFFFVSRLDYKSGWGTLSINYLKELNPNEVIVFCNKKNTDINFKQIETLHKPLDYLKNPFLIFFDYLKTKKVLQKYNSQNRYSHFPVEPYCLLLPFLRNMFSKNIYYAIGTYSLELKTNKKTKILFNMAQNKFDYIIYFSSFTKEMVEKEIKFDNKIKKEIINPVIYLKDFKNKNYKKFKDRTILCVGELKPRKGFESLIKVIIHLKKIYKKNYKLILIGKSDNAFYKRKLLSIIKENDVYQNIRFEHDVGEKKINNFYKKSHLFAMLSKKLGNHFEGFGIVYLEALFYGLPVIISRESGARDLLKVSDKIKVFNPDETKKIANYVSKLFKNNRKINPLIYRSILNKHLSINKLKLRKFYRKLI